MGGRLSIMVRMDRDGNNIYLEGYYRGRIRSAVINKDPISNMIKVLVSDGNEIPIYGHVHASTLEEGQRIARQELHNLLGVQ